MWTWPACTYVRIYYDQYREFERYLLAITKPIMILMHICMRMLYVCVTYTYDSVNEILWFGEASLSKISCISICRNAKIIDYYVGVWRFVVALVQLCIYILIRYIYKYYLKTLSTVTYNMIYLHRFIINIFTTVSTEYC